MPEPRKRARNNSAISTIVEIRVVPRSSKVVISREGTAIYKIRLTSPPVEGAANNQLLRILAQKLLIPGRDIQIVSGEKGRRKRIQVQGLNLEQISQRLAEE
jgi:uncharacterized protein (TIGR00251 family)